MRKQSKVPMDCGYNKSFKYKIRLGDYGVDGECIEGCNANCRHRWGWTFEHKEEYNEFLHNYEEQEAIMSFENKKEAFLFWFTNLKHFSNKKHKVEW
jgi:hypothetical protein